jgi:hypothetical protein
MQIIFNPEQIQELLLLLEAEERRACGLDNKAWALRRKILHLSMRVPDGISISLNHEELEGILL